MSRSYYSRQKGWLWSTITVPCKRSCRYGVVVFRTPRYFSSLADKLASTRALKETKGTAFSFQARMRKISV